MKAQFLLLAAAALLLLAAPRAQAAPSKSEAIKNLKELQPQLAQLKAQGAVGEVYTGYVGAVKGASGDVQSLIEKVNENRKVIYQAIAAEHGISAAKAGELAGVRNFREAEKGEYLKGRDGKWRQK
jgi:uncharacterized protein YdbL (DUF1318 family)